jgi:putative ABC transport system substrate-binding protein
MPNSFEMINRRAMGLGLGLLLLRLPTHAQSTRTVRIGVIRPAPVPVLDVNQQGFEAALAGAGFKAGVNVSYDIQTTGGDPNRAQAIVQKFIEEKVDLIHSMGTAPTLAALKAGARVPVVFSAVSDPVGAGIVPEGSKPGQVTGTQLTGVSDRWPIGLQLETYARLVPQARTWGTLYNPTEAGSTLQARQLREAATRLGLQLMEVTVGSTGEVRQAALDLASRVQAIFVISDATVSADILAIQEAGDRHRIPNFTGVVSGVRRGALAAFGVDYFLAGYAAGKKAALVLRGVNPGQIPWSLAEHFGLVLNQKAAKALGILLPVDMLRIADNVVE